MPPANGWNEYEKLVIDTLERHEQCLTDLKHISVKIREDIAVLKIKASIWGGLSGLIAGGLLYLIT